MYMYFAFIFRAGAKLLWGRGHTLFTKTAKKRLFYIYMDRYHVLEGHKLPEVEK